MKITKVKRYNSGLGWSIFIKEFGKKDYNHLLNLIDKIGLERDKVMERKLWVLGGKIKTNLIERVYDRLQFSYNARNKIISMTWKHPKLNGEEFTSILLSN